MPLRHRTTTVAYVPSTDCEVPVVRPEGKDWRFQGSQTVVVPDAKTGANRIAILSAFIRTEKYVPAETEAEDESSDEEEDSDEEENDDSN